MARVLVTGGLGFIGAELVARLVGRGDEVDVLDNLHLQVHPWCPPVPDGARFTVGDVRDGRVLASLVDGREVVVHLAAETGTGDSEVELTRYVSSNTMGTATLVQALRRTGQRPHLVLASSRVVYGEGPYRCERCGHGFTPAGRSRADLERRRWDPTCPSCRAPAEPLPMTEGSPPSPTSMYGWTKLHQEQLVHHAVAAGTVDATVLRLFNVYGPGQSPSNPYAGVITTFVRALTEGRPVELHEDGLVARDLLYVDDAVDAFVWSIDHRPEGGRLLNVGSGEAVTIGTLTAMLGRAMSRAAPMTVSGRFRPGDVRHACADITRARALGWEPATPLQTGLNRFTEWAGEQARPLALDGVAAGERQRAGVLHTSRAAGTT